MPLDVFYSYAHEDEELRNELDKSLALLRRRGLIVGWHDRRISAGGEWAAEIVTASASAPPVPAPEASSDDQLLEIWLHGRSLHTQRAYRADSARFRLGAGKPLCQITLSDLQQFADGLGDLAAASRYRTLSAVKSLLAFGHRIGYLPFDVGRVLRLPPVRNRLAERILPEADLHRILSLEPHPRNRAILTLLYASGVRVSELCELCWRDLQPNGEGGQIAVLGKGGVTRAVQIPASVWKLLQGLRGADTGPGDAVFRSGRGKTAVCSGRSPCSGSCAAQPSAPAQSSNVESSAGIWLSLADRNQWRYASERIYSSFLVTDESRSERIIHTHRRSPKLTRPEKVSAHLTCPASQFGTAS